MSVRMISRVWDFSAQKGNDLLMLLAIADFADDDGNAYPAVSTLATKCRMKPRNANLILAALKASGELEVRQNEGPNGTNRYRIVLPHFPLQVSTGVQKSTDCRNMSPTPVETYPKPLQVSTDEPSVNRQEPERGAARSPKGSRLPLDWSLPDEYREWSMANLGWSADQAKEIAERFADYWHAVTGKNATKADWFATWRNWCRREKPSGGKPTSNMTRSLPQPGAVRQRHGIAERFDEVAGWVPA